MTTELAALLLPAALALLLLAAGFDVARMEIPDGIAIGLLLLALLHWWLVPVPPGWSRLAAAAIMLALGLLLFSRGWMGGGDVKLLVALAPLIGLRGLPGLLLLVALAGGVVTLVLLAIRALLPARPDGAPPRAKLLRPGAPMPYAVAILLGAAVWAWQGRLLPIPG